MFEASGFDPDRFGYFDLVEELNKLGLDSWDRLSFKRKWGMEFIDIKGNAEVMLMLKFLTTVRTQVCDVYVVGGKNDGLEQIDEDKSVGGGDGVADTMGDEVVKHRVVEFEPVRKTNVESVNKSKCNTKSRTETTSNAGKLKRVSTKNIVEKSVENSVKKSLFQYSHKSVVESVGKSVGGRKSAAKEVGEDVGGRKSIAKDVGEDVEGRKPDGAPTPSVSVGMGDKPDESVGDKLDQSVGVDMGNDSVEDMSYIPSFEDGETNDDMEAKELVSEDE